MELGLRTELKQQISPQLMYSLKLLQYTTLELEQELKQKLEENPLLEVVEEDAPDQEEMEDEMHLEQPALEPQPDPDVGALKVDTHDIDWNAYIVDGMNSQMDSREEFEKKEEMNLLEREGRSGTTLEQHLLDQFHLLDISPQDREIGEYLIGNLEEDGLLEISLEMVAAELGVTVKDAERVLGMIQTLEPTGVGARTIQECLLLQLKVMDPDNALAATLIERFWDDVCNRRLAVIKKALKTSQEDIQDAIQVIAGLNPHPGLSISDEAIIPIFPDLIVEKVDGDYVVLLNDRHLPRLRISRAYHTILSRNGNATESERQFVRQKLNDANWLVSSIEQRRSTMLKVMNYIVEAQREFLDKGLPYLKPMILQDVADHVGVHPATVSRVTQGKYVQTPRGVFSLKFFFDGTIQKDGGEQLATKSVKDRIAQLIREENTDDPLSDQRLVEILQAAGMQIKRRTVAKYRDQLGIPTARMRKRI
jgi:RNA polymerase sigma-54 factor